MSSDAIVILKDEHKEMRRAFHDYERTTATETATRGEIADRIIELLTAHTYIENEVMYPQIRELAPELEHDILDSYEEHHLADLLIAEIAALEPYEERFDPKMTVLMESVRHHMDAEESEWFPQVRKAVGRNQLQEIGRDLQRAREQAPTRPPQAHPVARMVRSVLE